MTKSTRHKKARAEDFKKQKIKLGKGKLAQQNATNTTIASRSIALPQQSLSEAPKTEPVSRRNLTLPELLVQCRHYSTSVKKEALVEISGLLSSHPSLLSRHLLPIMNALSHLISDAVPSLRTAARGLLDKICDQLPEDTVAAASRGLVLFTLAALSSLDEGTRIDALKVIDLLLDKVPGEIVRGWEEAGEEAEDLRDRGVGSKVVEALLGVLRVRSVGLAVGQGGFTSASSGDLSPSSRLAVLSTLSTFLTAALSPSLHDIAWYLEPSFANSRAYEAFLRSFTPNLPIGELYPLANPSASEIHPLASLQFFSASSGPSSSTPSAAGPSTNNSTPRTSREALLPLLHPTLLASFLDAAPTAFSPSTPNPPPQERQTITAVLGVAKVLYWAALGSGKSAESEGKEERKLLVGLLTHVGGYFPFGADAVEQRPAEVEQQLLELNLVFASLVSLLILTPAAPPLSATIPSSKPKSAKKLQKAAATSGKIVTMVSAVSEWVVTALQGEITSPLYPMGVQLSAEAFEALEPTLWALLNKEGGGGGEDGMEVDDEEGGKGKEEVFVAVLRYFESLSPGSEGKRRALAFIARAALIGTQPAYIDRHTISSTDAGSAKSKIGKWILSLPKLIWELGVKQPDTTELALLFLHRIASQGEKGIYANLLPLLQPSLGPFFHMQHPKRGGIPGPFVRLPESVQLRALDLVWYFGEVGDEAQREKLRGAVSDAVMCVGVEETVKSRWANMRW